MGKFSADRPFFTILQDLTPVKISLPISLNLETRLFRIFIESKFFSFGISEKEFRRRIGAYVYIYVSLKYKLDQLESDQIGWSTVSKIDSNFYSDL